MKDTHFFCHNLNYNIAGRVVLKDIHFSTSSVGLISIRGENSTGKTTLLRILSQFLLPESGEIGGTFYLSHLNPGSFSFLPSTSLGLLPELSAAEHIQLIRQYCASKEKPITLQHIEKHALWREMLPKKVSEYSNGMKQLLRIYLHLFFSPKLIFLDEPLIHLSPEIKNLVIDLIDELSDKSLIFYADVENWKGKSVPIHELRLEKR